MDINTEVKAGLETNHIIDLSDRLYKIILAIIALVAVYIIGQMAYDFKALPQNYPREIYVNGEGKALVKPDIATINFGVTAEAPKSQDAVNQSNEKMSAVLKAVKDSGVEDKDIKTTYYNLSPIYGQDRSILPMGSGVSSDSSALYYPYPSSTKITGYRLEQQVEVKIRNLDKVNEVIDKVTTAGANNVSGPQFTVDDMEKVREEAREMAIINAKEKAKTLAKQAGLKLDKLMNVSEGYYGYPMAYGLGGANVSEKDMASPAIAPQIEPGQTEVTINVTLTYRIK